MTRHAAVTATLLATFVALGLVVAPAVGGARLDGLSGGQSVADPVLPGETVRITVNVDARGYDAPAVDVTLPDGWTVTTQESDGATYRNDAVQWLWLSGGTHEVAYTVRVPATTDPGRYDVVANVSAQDDETDQIESDRVVSTVRVVASTATTTKGQTPTATERRTPTATERRTPTATERRTPTATARQTPTFTPAPTPTPFPTPTPTEAPTTTPSPTPTRTATNSPTPTPSPTPATTTTDGGIQDTDGDGVIDSEDYAPRDPDVQEASDLNPTDTSTGTPGFGAGVAVVALLAVVGYATRRRN